MLTPTRLAFLAAAVLAAACHPPRTDRKVADQTTPPPLRAPQRSLVELSAHGTSTLVSVKGDKGYAVRLRVTAPPLAATDRPPLHLALVLDTSGSMEGAAIDAARGAAHTLIDKMGPRDQVALVAFHSRSEVVVPMGGLDPAGRARVHAAIDGLRAHGTTDLSAGLAAGLTEVGRGHTADSLDRVVLLSDGVPNDGQALPQLVAHAAQQRIPIAALGVGIEFDEALLGRIAHDTGGIYRYAPEPAQLAAVFDEEIMRMQRMVASNLQLTLRPGPGVTFGDAPWLQANGSGRLAVLGDLAAGETRDVFVPVTLGAHSAGASIEVLDADLTFLDVATGAAEQRQAFVGVKASDDAQAVAASVVIDLAAGRARAEAAGVILQAIGLARQGQLEQADKLLTEGERVARATADKTQDDELRTLASRMADVRRNLVHLRTAGVVEVVPPQLLGRDQPRPAPASAYPLARRPTAPAPAEAEAAIKAAYDASAETLRGD